MLKIVVNDEEHIKNLKELFGRVEYTELHEHWK